VTDYNWLVPIVRGVEFFIVIWLFSSRISRLRAGNHQTKTKIRIVVLDFVIFVYALVAFIASFSFTEWMTGETARQVGLVGTIVLLPIFIALLITRKETD
jgi:hypothetical protein